MTDVAIVTDSSSCLPPESVQQYDITVVPMRIIIGEHIYRDGVDITPGEVYHLQRSSHLLPTTSAPSPGEFLEAFRSASRKSPTLLSFAISHKLSMVFESAVKAREIARTAMPGTRIEVFDARTAAGAHGLLVLAAARVVAGGGSLDDALAEVERILPKMHLVAALDTLDFLAKGGRIPRAQAWASSVLSVKPILQVVDGEAVPLERIRTKPRAIKRLIEIMNQRAGNHVHVNIMHAGVPDEAEEIRRQLLSQFQCEELYVTEFTPVMGVHTGPGLVGLAFYSED